MGAKSTLKIGISLLAVIALITSARRSLSDGGSALALRGCRASQSHDNGGTEYR